MKKVRQRTNATNRLFLFLAAMDRHPKNVGTPLIEVERACVRTSGSSQSRADLETQSIVWKLFLNAEREIRAYLGQELDLYLRPFEELMSALGPRVAHIPWNQSHQRLKEKYISEVEYTAQRLKPLVPEALLDEEDFSHLRQELDALLSDIESSDIGPDTRNALLRRCARMKEALDMYSVTGADGIEEAYVEFARTIILNQEIQVELKQEPKNRGSLGNRILSVLLALNLLIGEANEYHDAYKNFVEPFIQKLLPAPNSSFEPPTTPSANRDSSSQTSV